MSTTVAESSVLSASQDSLDSYLAEIAQYPLLSAHEERTLAVRIQQGDEAARTRFLHANLRLVISIAKRYRGLGFDLLDLIGEGNLGLVRAVDTFDPEKGCTFSTYATHWIRQAIMRTLDNTARPIRLPLHVAEKLRALERVRIEHVTLTGEEPTGAQFAGLLGLPSSTIAALLDARTLGTISLSTPVGGEEGWTLADETSATPDEHVYQQAHVSERAACLDALLSCLTDRECAVIVGYYGLDGRSKRRTYASIGRSLGCSREWVRHLHSSALAQLRQFPWSVSWYSTDQHARSERKLS